MNRRLGKAQRILAAQTELDRLAVWMLVDIESREVAIEKRLLELGVFLEVQSPFGGLFAAAMMRRLDGLEKSRAALRVEREAQIEKRLAERGRMRRAQAIVKALEIDERRRQERRELEAAVDASLRRPAQGSGKFGASS